MAPCIIVARFRAREGQAGEAEARLRGFLEPSRLEDGCLFYDLHRDSDRPGEFVILDGWRDEAAFEAHAASAHVARTLAGLEPFLDGPPAITRLERLS